MLKIYLARHGRDEDNRDGILNGHRDKPLTELGRSQALAVATKAKDVGLRFDFVYTTPLLRGRETVDIICELTDSPRPAVEDLLIERDFGVMTGEKVADVEMLCAPNIFKTKTVVYFLNPEGAETFPDLMARARVLLDTIGERHTSGNILLQTHGDVGKMIYAEYYHLDWKEVLAQFHFGNAELLLLSEDSPAEQAHVFEIEQHNL